MKKQFVKIHLFIVNIAVATIANARMMNTAAKKYAAARFPMMKTLIVVVFDAKRAAHAAQKVNIYF
ncbi:hypothetical protein TVAG_004630 [Trichomonas vaginalis G3]|uniref:Uncharacterized protein n=1 Tax=Trichomonas vaginalis (strain ATCC PRA-98 / G3) TaxID=412133 RepID=A2DT25_TRIV3|nr:hypothetical protein TVAGG3_0648910 [Trichomonas vaginalis G3]EAY16432.1 hypothetical protein TVAG_004630 [Trichomonas vaginalis G3]KAI5505702.1 hypothetical protein TVAGG3_0648910 [Trichomonas vaginalis G3]|eukprot:XP_001328655.1 hypothetical protein [Trichomonas vaginalis G3]